ncbi:MAG: Hcp family type VI secretion system effector, partial [Desulfosarcinaceae bacterium]
MPTPAYLTIEGETQGDITAGVSTEESVGNFYQEDHENEILVQAFRHKVIIPWDDRGERPAGNRVHHPLTITKVFDKSSPLLYRSLAISERLKKCELKFYRTSTSGTQEHFFTIELENALITQIEPVMPNCQDPSKA